MNPLFSLAGLIVNSIKDYLQRNQELKRAKHEAEVKRIQSADEHSGRLDEISLESRGWKDEYLLLITTTPLLIVFFVPLFAAESGQHLVNLTFESFESLNRVPEWYRWLLLGIYIDTFGFRRMLRAAVEGWLKSKFGG